MSPSKERQAPFGDTDEKYYSMVHIVEQISISRNDTSGLFEKSHHPPLIHTSRGKGCIVVVDFVLYSMSQVGEPFV